jgi:hypothetical protein
MSEENNVTRAWELYEKGRTYNNRLVPNQYRLVNTNIEFFAGNQWLNIPETPAMARLPKPVFNIIKRVASLFVASLTSSGAAIRFEPLSSERDPDEKAAEYATAEVANLLEKFQMEYKIREALFDGAQTGDYCAHFWWDPDAAGYGGAPDGQRGEIRMELVDGINVMFGNPNTPDVESQPYILIVGRAPVESLREEMKKNRDKLQADSEFEFQAGTGGKIEIEPDDRTGKALYVYLYTKVTREQTAVDPLSGEPLLEPETDRDGNPICEETAGGKRLKMREVKRRVTSVHVTKATRTAVIFEDVDTGLSRYPIAWGNWEKQKNQYHGRALVTGIIPNQIFINTMFAMVMRHLQLLGFPKTVYNADLVGSWSNEIGQAIGVRGLQPGQPISQVAYNLQPADMSNQILSVIDRAMSYTKDCLGATDAQLGSVRPDNTSALMVLQSSAEVPLENTRAGLHRWIEDIGAILLDMMGTYYGVRTIVRSREFKVPVIAPDGLPLIDPDSGAMAVTMITRRVAETFDFDVFKNLFLNLRADVGASSYYSEIAVTQTLDNLRQAGVLDVIQYLERVPDKLIPKKAELIDQLKAAADNARSEAAARAPGGGEKTAAAAGGGLSPEQAVGALPNSVQARYASLPGSAKKALGKMNTPG